MTERFKLLLVEDDGYWLDEYYKYLVNEGYDIETARTIQEAFDLMDQSQFDAVVTDLKMIGFGHEFGGLDVFKRVKELDPCTEVVMITGYGTHQIAADVNIRGVFDYIKKPPTENVFRFAVRGALEGGRKKHQDFPGKQDVSMPSKKAKRDAAPDEGKLFGLMGNSTAMRAALEKISNAVHTAAPVFIFGEPGTGKTYVAKAIHTNSTRRNRPFSLLNFSDLSKHWASVQKTIGRIKGGTLLLDNVAGSASDAFGSLSSLVEELKANDVRLIITYPTDATSPEALRKEISLPDDFFESIARVPIFVPPLRDRKDGDDIPALVGHFLHLLSADLELEDEVSISSGAIERFVNYDYPKGNIKELYGIVKQAVELMGGAGEIVEEHILISDPTNQVSESRPGDVQKPVNYAFVSYFSEDTEIVDRLQKDLQNLGIQLWRDRDQLYPGMRWKSEIRQAIKGGANFIACFSKARDDRDTSYVYAELYLAIEELRLRPRDRAWFIPVKLTDCDIPDFDIGGGESLSDIQYLDLFTNWEKGINTLAAVIRKTDRTRK